MHETMFNTCRLSKQEITRCSFKKFGDYCKPMRNLTVTSSTVQQSANQFMKGIKLLSLDCEYETFKDEMIRYCLVVEGYKEKK